MMFYPTDLLRELLASEEEAQQAADDHGQHRQDEQSILLADILHPAPHFIQSHRHPPPPPPTPPPGPECNFTRPPSEKPPLFSQPKKSLIQPYRAHRRHRHSGKKKQKPQNKTKNGAWTWRTGCDRWMKKVGLGHKIEESLRNRKIENKEIKSCGFVGVKELKR